MHLPNIVSRETLKNKKHFDEEMTLYSYLLEKNTFCNIICCMI